MFIIHSYKKKTMEMLWNYYYHASMNDMTYFMSERLKLSSNPHSTMSLYVSLMLYNKSLINVPPREHEIVKEIFTFMSHIRQTPPLSSTYIWMQFNEVLPRNKKHYLERHQFSFFIVASKTLILLEHISPFTCHVLIRRPFCEFLMVTSCTVTFETQACVCPRPNPPKLWA